MEIQGPFTIAISEDAAKGIRELHFSFTNEFQSMKHDQRIVSFEAYISQLTKVMNKTDDLANRQGMLTVLQISEQLLPHIKADEIPLQETIIVEMGEQAEGSSLADLLNSSKLN